MQDQPVDLTVVMTAARRRGPTVVAAEALVTDGSWFDGVDPATAWVLVWLEQEHVGEAPAPVRAAAARVGYRLGRLLLDIAEHPAVAAPDRCDAWAERLYRATARTCTPSLFGGLPSVLYEALSLCAVRLTARHVHRPARDDDHRLEVEAAAFAAAFSGFILAVLEGQLVDAP